MPLIYGKTTNKCLNNNLQPKIFKSEKPTKKNKTRKTSMSELKTYFKTS